MAVRTDMRRSDQPNSVIAPNGREIVQKYHMHCCQRALLPARQGQRAPDPPHPLTGGKALCHIEGIPGLDEDESESEQEMQKT